MSECNHEYPITACFDCGTRLDESQLQSQLTALRAQLDSARKVIEHYGDYKTWPGHNPAISKEWYESGGYHGYDLARKWLAENKTEDK